MGTDSATIENKIRQFVGEYSEMEILGKVIPCPYWSNKIKEGKVRIRGFLEGKGSAKDLREEIIRRWQIKAEKNLILNSLNLQKFAKRERLGIDCSGFAYRFLDKLVHLGYKNCQVNDLAEVFPGGINRANADLLTNSADAVRISKISRVQLGDLIRLNSGKHVVIILEKNDSHLIYAHSSSQTKTDGVHSGEIKLKTDHKTLLGQEWQEKTKRGNNFGQTFFKPGEGDGIFRLKIFEASIT